MSASIEDIKRWFHQAPEETTHMIVVCDEFDWTDYPVYVSEKANVHDVYLEYSHKPMQRIMEVYKMDLGWDAQGAPNQKVLNF